MRNSAVVVGALVLFLMTSSRVDAQIPKVDNGLLFHYVKYMERWPADSELTAAAPEVTLSAFEDFQGPDCADEAKMLKERLPPEFGKQVRIVFHD